MSFEQARSFLLRREVDSATDTWRLSAREPSRLLTKSIERRHHDPPPGFSLHESLALPGSALPVHRFVYEAERAHALNAQLLREARVQNSWPHSMFGVEISNVAGYHSAERAFLRSEPHAWYGALLANVLYPALRARAVSVGSVPGEDGLDDDGVPREGRIAGWLNVNNAFAFNQLHAHPESTWALVYFVSSGERVPESSNAADGESTLDDRGALLLTTCPDDAVHGERRRHYYAVPPSPGELWCFPGAMEHAVMPRELLPHPDRSHGMRVSVAVNIYPISSAHRDAQIGHPQPNKWSRSCIACDEMQSSARADTEGWSWLSLLEMSCGLNGRQHKRFVRQGHQDLEDFPPPPSPPPSPPSPSLPLPSPLPSPARHRLHMRHHLQ